MFLLTDEMNEILDVTVVLYQEIYAFINTRFVQLSLSTQK